MKLNRLFLLLLFFIFGNELFSCSCDYNDPRFCRAVTKNNHIVLAVVTNTPDEYSMEIKVLDTVRKQTPLDTISVLGQDGLNCGERVKIFKQNDTLILALELGQFRNAMTLEYHDAYLHGCGLHYLSYRAGRVVGTITETLDQMSYQDFKNSIESCVAMVPSNTTNLNANFNLSVFPNPAKEELTIKFEFKNFEKITFDILNSIGHPEIRDLKLVEGSNQINIKKLKRPGLYFLRGRSREGIIVRKFLKI